MLSSVFLCEVGSYWHTVNFLFHAVYFRRSLHKVVYLQFDYPETSILCMLSSDPRLFACLCYTETFQLFFRVYRISKSIVPITKDILNSHVSFRVDNEFIRFFDIKFMKHLFYFYLEILLWKQHAGRNNSTTWMAEL